MIKPAYQPLIIVSNNAISETEYDATRLAMLNHTKSPDDVVYTSKKSHKVVSYPGMPKMIEYVSTLELREISAITEINSDTVQTQALDDDMIECTTLQPILIRFDVEAGIYRMPIITRLEPGYSFEVPLEELVDPAALKTFLAFESVDHCHFPLLKQALTDALES